jgi:hypothetical protein
MAMPGKPGLKPHNESDCLLRARDDDGVKAKKKAGQRCCQSPEENAKFVVKMVLNLAERRALGNSLKLQTIQPQMSYGRLKLGRVPIGSRIANEPRRLWQKVPCPGSLRLLDRRGR